MRKLAPGIFIFGEPRPVGAASNKRCVKVSNGVQELNFTTGTQRYFSKTPLCLGGELYWMVPLILGNQV